MTASPQIPSVDVAIINWRTAEYALHAARGFRRSRDVHVRVTVVDNNSGPIEQDHLQAGCPDGVSIQLQTNNLGYGRAANVALADADADCVCVCNADVVPRQDMLMQLTQVVLSDPAMGAAAPRLLPGGDGYHTHLPTGGMLVLRPFAGSLGRRSVRIPSYGAVATVGQPAGACLVLRTSVWRELGGFDPDFFLFYEDVDLAKRLRAVGLRNVIVGSAAADHNGGRSVGQVDALEHQALRLRSLGLYARKHHRKLWPLVRVGVTVAAAVRGTVIGGPAAGARLMRATQSSGQHPDD